MLARRPAEGERVRLTFPEKPFTAVTLISSGVSIPGDPVRLLAATPTSKSGETETPGALAKSIDVSRRAKVARDRRTLGKEDGT